MKEILCEPCCSDGWTSFEDEVNGECPDCGTPTVNGGAAYGCCWSQISCETCGHTECDGSC